MLSPTLHIALLDALFPTLAIGSLSSVTDRQDGAAGAAASTGIPDPLGRKVFGPHKSGPRSRLAV